MDAAKAGGDVTIRTFRYLAFSPGGDVRIRAETEDPLNWR